MKDENFLQVYETKELLKNDLIEIIGLVLFTTAHPYTIKCLRDDDFWNALNEKSGKRWAVFSVKPQEAKLIQNPLISRGGLGHLIPIWEEPDFNKKLLDTIGIKDTSILPIFIVALKKGDILLTCHIDINDDSIESVYKSLSNIIGKATRVIEQINKENLQNSSEIFNLLKDELASQRFVKQMHKVDKFWRDLLERLPI